MERSNLVPPTGEVYLSRKIPPTGLMWGMSKTTHGPSCPSPWPSTGEWLRRRDAGPVRPGRPPSTAPLQAPGAAGPLDGEVLTNKSSQGRADAQRLVATRLLDRVHDPLGHFSRLQRIYPRAR